MLLPHWGQTRFMIDEIRLALGSPGSVSMMLMVYLPYRGFLLERFRIVMRGAAGDCVCRLT